VVQRHVLYLGEINDAQELAWRRSIEVLEEGAAQPRTCRQQCRLLAVSRSSVYRQPAAVSAEERTIMALIDWQYLARPYYGSRRMTAWLATQGHVSSIANPCSV
jgi:hypothetical protein